MIGRVRWQILALLGLLAAAPPTDQDAFTRDFAGRIGRAMPGQHPRIVSPLTLEIRTADGTTATINLDRVWTACRNGTGAECDESRGRFITALGELVSRPPTSRAQLREMVRSQDYCAAVRQRMTGAQNEPLIRPVPGGLCAVLVFDQPHSMDLLRRPELETLGLAEDEAWTLAERQTLSHLPSPAEFDFHDRIVAIAGMDYIPSLILASDGWRALARTQGELLLAVPSDGSMIVVRAADSDLPRFQALVAQDFAAAERGISPHVFHWTDAGWSPLP